MKVLNADKAIIEREKLSTIRWTRIIHMAAWSGLLIWLGYMHQV
jgi:hypothetical protein